MPFRFFLGLALGAMGLLAGCAGSGSSNSDAPFNLIITERTPLFIEGPQQAKPPESYLERGTRIRVIATAGAYYQVETVPGQKGFVSADACSPAPSEQREATPQGALRW